MYVLRPSWVRRRGNSVNANDPLKETFKNSVDPDETSQKTVSSGPALFFTINTLLVMVTCLIIGLLIIRNYKGYIPLEKRM